MLETVSFIAIYFLYSEVIFSNGSFDSEKYYLPLSKQLLASYLVLLRYWSMIFGNEILNVGRYIQLERPEPNVSLES